MKASPAAAAPRDEAVLVLAPTGRDAALARTLLAQAGFTALVCADMAALCRELGAGAGVVLLAEEALSPDAARSLAGALTQQAPWSDVPLVVFSGADPSSAAAQRTLAAIEPLGNVTLLDRPVRVVSLVSAIRVALRARRRQYQVRDLLAQRDRAVRDRDQFLAMLGHELRNPLAAIVFALDLIDRAGLSGDAARRRWETIGRHVRHLSRLVDDMLDVSRVTSGKIKLTRAPVDLVALARRCAESTAAVMKAQGVALDVAADAGPIVVQGDAIRLEQVVSNLLTNAIKYTPSGGRVRLAVERAAGQVEIRVEDTGIGIPADMLPRIFEAFTQVDGSLDRSRGGLGLGLTLVRSLVELHGGAVDAASDGLGRGSRFVVRLPLAATQSASAADTAPLAAARGAGGTRRVVVIEDNTDVREGLQLLLTSSGHDVDAVGDGPAGVARVLEAKPDVVLVDLGLPGLDGFGVARAIRAALGKRVYLAAISGYGLPEDQQRAREAGFDAHLTKPVTIEAVERLLAG